MMNVLRRIAMGIGGVVIAVLLLALAAPKAVHAIVSTLVTVANTSSNPVPMQQIKQSTNNYLTLQWDISNQVYDQLLPDGTSTPFVIPAGEELVITDVNWVIFCGYWEGTYCQNHAGDSVGVVLGRSSGTPAGFYAAQSTFVSDAGNLFAMGSDSFKSGVNVSQLPTPAFFGGQYVGQGILGFTLRGYLVP
jgi:hypothetical protein